MEPHHRGNVCIARTALQLLNIFAISTVELVPPDELQYSMPRPPRVLGFRWFIAEQVNGPARLGSLPSIHLSLSTSGGLAL